MGDILSTDVIKRNLVFKNVHVVKRGGEKEEGVDSMYRPGVKLDLQRSRYLTESYKETEGEPMVFRRAKAIKNILTRMDIYIRDREKIVGNCTAEPEGLFFGIDMNYRAVKRVVESREGRSLLDDEGRKELNELIAYWKGRCMSDIQQKTFTGEVLEYWHYRKLSPGSWSQWSELGVPDYEKALRVGLRGLIDQAEERLAEIDRTVPPDYIDQKDFLQSVIIALDAVIDYAHRYADLAREKAAAENDPAEKERLEEIAAICDRVPEYPAETLREALQSFYFLLLVRFIEYTTVGIGTRFDKVFGPYYENDVRLGRMTFEGAVELIQMLWVKIQELGMMYSPTLSAVYGGVGLIQSITLGGTDGQGRDITNGMTYAVLEASKRMRTPEPTICMRVHDGTPDELMSAALDVVKTGIGYPSFFNDASMLPLLQRWNVPIEDARDYAISGCVYLEIPGKNVTRKAYGGMNLPLALLYALNEGGHPVTGERNGAPTPDPRTFTKVEDIMDAYSEQIRFFFSRQVKIENTCQALYERYLPRPFLSAIIQGCIEKGQDCRKWGYESPIASKCIILGPSNAADSITAIKKNVFDDRKITMDELLQAMAANWEGYEDVRQLMINAPKYGNDDDYADLIADELQQRTAAAMEESKNRFGQSVRGDGSGISATYSAGAIVPATPDGRKAGEPLSDATLSPVFGMDHNGPTAVLKSASKISTEKSYNHLLNQKFSPSVLDDDQKETFKAYLKTWKDLGVNQIQFNLVDRAELLDAQANPEKHPDLLVRVAGYSAYFVDLSKGLQDSIIARTEQAF